MCKKLMYIVLCFALLMIPCFTVCAEESYPELEDDPDFVEYLPNRDGEESTKNDKGQVTEGYFRLRYRRWTDDKKAYSFCYSYDASTDEANCLYILFFDSDENNVSSWYKLCGSDSAKVQRTYYSENVYGEFNNSITDPVNVSFVSGSYKNGYSLISYRKIDTTAIVFETNIPVFNSDDTESINAYVEDGDYSGAINSDDINTPPVEYDEVVEKPKNLRTYGNVENIFGAYDKSGQITVRWDVPQNQIDSYSYDVQVRSCYIYAGKPVWTNWNTKVSDFPYNGRDVYDLTTGNKVDRSPTLPEDFIVTQKLLYENVPSAPDDLITGATRYAIKDFDVRIRNRSGGKCSNWVSIKVSADNKHVATVTDDNGNVVEDEDYNGQDVNNSNQDTYYDTDHQNGNTDGLVNTDNVSISSILGFIKSGFGLLGDNGIIALMSRTYLYLPGSIWTIIKFFVAMLVVISIIGAIKEVL